MPRVDFYILPTDSSKNQFACTLANKIWNQGLSIYFNVTSRETAETLDYLLWTYRDISFLPHCLANSDPESTQPIVIGWSINPVLQHDTVINLTPDVPPLADNFARIAEIVAGNQHDKETARIRYKFYRDSGYEIHNHVIEGNSRGR